MKYAQDGRADAPVRQDLSPKGRELVQAGRNYAVYQHSERGHVFAVLGTGAEPEPYERQGFQKLEDLGPVVAQLRPPGEAPRSLLLHVHGYSNDSRGVATQTSVLSAAFEPEDGTAARHAWVTYDWPGEKAATVSTLRRSLRTLGDYVLGLLLWSVLFAVAFLVWDGVPRLFGATPTLDAATRFQVVLSWVWPVLIVFVWPLFFVILVFRLAAYHRDRYVSIHQGVPDLCEFLRHLDYYACEAVRPGAAEKGEGLEADTRIRLSVVAHSMGCLLTLNALRALSNLFHGKPDAPPEPTLGNSLLVDTLILVAPDVPVELIQVSQNNYFYAAMRRFRRMYVFSNAHDAILRDLSGAANAFAEPQPGSSRYRLGNVFFARETDRTHLGLAVRVWYRAKRIFETAEERSARPDRDRRESLYLAIQERVSFIDCSRRPALGAVVRRVSWLPPIRNLLALLLHFTGLASCHSGYFRDPGILRRMRSALLDTPKSGEPGNELLPARDS